jgi:CBS domain-containing protein
MNLRALATCPAMTCNPTTTIGHAAQLMASAGVGFLVVVRDERPVGVVTDRDIVVRAVASHRDHETPVSDVMSTHPVEVDEGDSLEHAATLMADKQCRRLPVTSEGRLIGVLSLDDLLRATGDELRQVARAVRGTKHDRLTAP